MKIYIAGPMTGIPEFNFPAFHAAAKRLRAEGHCAINPAEVNPDPATPWVDCMRKDIPKVLECEAIYLLPGWDKSKGALLEMHIAEALGMTVIYQ
jgi:hypothetical protein